MIIVTGGAGLIGANLVKGLNDAGYRDILVVDNLTNGDKVRNLADLDIADYMDKVEFFDAINRKADLGSIEAIFHQGACSDTMENDGRYVLQNNFTYSKALYQYCAENGVRLIYASSASVYGSGEVFVESPENESTLNAYAYSKLLFDNFVRRRPNPGFQVVGLRYFNVYGPREMHKGRMASVAWHFRNQYLADGKVKLFKGTDGYTDGEQQRDFVSVEDVVAVNLYLLENPQVSGIFNVGTGRCQSFNDVAVSVVNAMRQKSNQPPLGLEGAVSDGVIEYIPMPVALHGKYQSYTEANLDKLRSAGYTNSFYSVQEGVTRYMDWLDKHS